MSYIVYILRCADKTLYTGIAVDIEKRLLEHNGKRRGGAKYTHGRRPVKLVYMEKCTSRSVALVREHAIKKLSRVDKNVLIKRKHVSGKVSF